MLIFSLGYSDGAPWVAQLRDLYEVHEQGAPQFHRGWWRKFFDVPAYKELFQPPEEKVFEYVLPATNEIVTNRAFSKSYMTVLSPEDKAKAESGIKAILEKGEGRKWIDESQGIFEYPYKTWVVIVRRK